jgi:hypothetical protein
MPLVDFHQVSSSPAVLSAALVGLQLLSFILGQRLALLRRRQGSNASDSLSIIAGGILGLTAFVLALTLSLATTRMQERRQEGWQEANAIYKTWAITQILSDARSPDISALLGNYGALRRVTLLLDEGDPQISIIAGRIADIQSRLLEYVAGIVKVRSDDVTASLASALTDLFASTNQQRLAVANQMPTQINLLMLVLVFAGMGVIGHQVGMTGQSHPVLTIMLIGIWTFIVVLILDFGDSRAGSFRTSTEAYEMVLDEMKVASRP